MQLAQLGIFASTQAFLFGGHLKNTLAADGIDLRPFLEGYLLDKPYQNDYTKNVKKQEVLFRHVKLMQTIKKSLEKKVKLYDKRLNETYETTIEVFQCTVYTFYHSFLIFKLFQDF